VLILLYALLQVRGGDFLTASGFNSHSNQSGRMREEGRGRGNHRQLLGTMATPLHAPHTSFIMLEGVDSVGNVIRGVGGAQSYSADLSCGV
jgi:hypothetical protein